MLYQNVTMRTAHLVCFRHEDNQEFFIILTPHTMQAVDFSDKALAAYENPKPLPEYAEWKKGTLQKMGYQACTLADYIFAQDTLLSWTRGKTEAAPANVKGTHFHNFQLT